MPPPRLTAEQAKLANDNAKLPAYCARVKLRVNPRSVLFDEMVSDGLDELWRCTRTYDPRRVKFHTYAMRCIRRRQVKTMKRHTRITAHESSLPPDLIHKARSGGNEAVEPMGGLTPLVESLSESQRAALIDSLISGDQTPDSVRALAALRMDMLPEPEAPPVMGSWTPEEEAVLMRMAASGMLKDAAGEEAAAMRLRRTTMCIHSKVKRMRRDDILPSAPVSCRQTALSRQDAASRGWVVVDPAGGFFGQPLWRNESTGHVAGEAEMMAVLKSQRRPLPRGRK